MASLKNNPQFQQHVSDAINNFHQHMQANGFNVQLNRLTFQADPSIQDCKCGTEVVLNSQTGEWETRCKRCPPPPANQ